MAEQKLEKASSFQSGKLGEQHARLNTMRTVYRRGAEQKRSVKQYE